MAYYQINQFNNGLTGHVDISITDNLGTQTFGLNYGVNSQGQRVGGWFAENQVLQQLQSQGYLYNQSSKINVSESTAESVISRLNTYVSEAGAMGSPGYSLGGKNCVDGVEAVLGMLDDANSVASYLKPNSTAVYGYAVARAEPYYIPLLLPNGPQVFNAQNLATAVGEIVTYIGQGIAFAIGQLGGNSTQTGGQPNDPATGSITITVNQTTHTATIDYSDAQNMSLYDSSGNVIGTQAVTGPYTFVPEDITNAMSSYLDYLADEYDF